MIIYDHTYLRIDYQPRVFQNRLTEDLQGTQIPSGQAKTMYVLLQTFPSTSGFWYW